MKNKRWLLALIPIAAIALMADSCDSQSPNADATQNQQQEQQTVVNNQVKLQQVEPVPVLSDSLERKNIITRLNTFNDPNKVSYIYLISYGKVMSFYTIKGKVTSGNKRLTSTDQIVDDGDPSTSDTKKVVEAPELDGTYGNSNPYIFFWTTSGVYVQWSGDYMLVDQPLQLSTPPDMVMSVPSK
jgi:hypothetical protein